MNDNQDWLTGVAGVNRYREQNGEDWDEVDDGIVEGLADGSLEYSPDGDKLRLTGWGKLKLATKWEIGNA